MSRKKQIAALAALAFLPVFADPDRLFFNNIESHVERIAPKNGKKGAWKTRLSLFFADAANNSVRIESSSLSNSVITVSPKVESLKVYNSNYGGLSLEGDFIPGSNYTVTVSAGLKGDDGSVLAKDARLSHRVEKPKTRPSLKVATDSQYMYLPLSAEPKLPFIVNGRDEYDFRLYRTYDNMLGPECSLWKSDSVRYAEPLGKIKRVFAAPSPDDEGAAFLDLRDFEDFKGRPGFYFISYSWKSMPDWSNNAVVPVFITDLALQTVVGNVDGGIAATVMRRRDGSPVEGAEVEAVTRDNQTVPLGKTGPGGFIKAVLPPAAFAAGLSGVSARTDGDFIYMPVGWESGVSSSTLSSGSFKTPSAFVHLDRGICRPGDSFTASVLVRDAQNHILKNAPCTLELTRWGDEIMSKKVKTDEHGFASCEFEVPASLRSGSCTIECNDGWGSTQINVASYTPDRIRASLGSVKKAVGCGERAKFKLSAEYYFHAKIPSGRYNATSYGKILDPLSFPDSWQIQSRDGDWTVGDKDATDCSVRWNLKADGMAALPACGDAEFELPAFSDSGKKAYMPFKRIVEATVAEDGGRSTTAYADVDVYPHPWFAAARKRDGAIDIRAVYAPGREKEADDGIRSADCPPVEVRISRVEWNPHLVRNGTRYTREWVRETIPVPEASFSVSAPSLKGSGASHGLEPLRPGCYEAEIVCGSAVRTRLEFWHSAGQASPRSSNPSVTTLKCDAQSYAPGSVAKLSLRSPCKAVALVATGERGFDGFRAVQLKSGMNEIEVGVPASVQGTEYYAGVTVVSQNGPDPVRSFALAKIPVDQSAHRLQAEIEMPASARPGERVKLKVKVSRKDGTPVPGAFVRVQLSDSGTLALTRFATPDPFAHFWRAGDEPFSFYDMFGMMYPELRITPDGRFGGGAAVSDALLRSMIEEKPAVRVILAPAVAGPDGTAETEFEVPDHSGELRAMAVVSCEDAAGCGDAAIAVARAHDILVSSPRFVHPGDSFDAVATVFNNTSAPADYIFALEGSGAVKPADSAPRTGSLAPGSSALVTFKVDATGAPGGESSAIAAKISVDGGKTFFERRVPVCVRPPRPPAVIPVFARIGPGEVLSSEWFAGLFESACTGECVIAASPAVAIAPAVKWLLEYPYGCLEQTSSAALPFIAAPEMAKIGLAADPLEAETFASRVDRAVARVLSCCDGANGFYMWPDATKSSWKWTDAGLHAAAFLAEASRRPAGAAADVRPVPKNVRDWLVSIAYASDMKAGSVVAEIRERRALAAWALSRAGDDRGANAARSILAREDRTFAAFAAAAALVNAGYAEEGAGTMKACAESGVWRNAAQTDLFKNFPAARKGFFLAALAEIPRAVQDSTIAEIAGDLVLSSNPADDVWGGTFANAWAAYGLLRATARDAASAASVKEEKFAFSESSPHVFTNTADTVLWARAVAAGVPRKGVLPEGRLVLSRKYENTANREFGRVLHGDLVKVTLTVSGDALSGAENLVLTDLVPGGFEIEDPSLATRSGGATCPENRPEGVWNLRCERRDDRCLFFFNVDRNHKTATFSYNMRAASRGRFAKGDATVEAMYDSTLRASARDDTPVAVE